MCLCEMVSMVTYQHLHVHIHTYYAFLILNKKYDVFVLK